MLVYVAIWLCEGRISGVDEYVDNLGIAASVQSVACVPRRLPSTISGESGRLRWWWMAGGLTMTTALPGRPIQNEAPDNTERFQNSILLVLGLALIGAA